MLFLPAVDSGEGQLAKTTDCVMCYGKKVFFFFNTIVSLKKKRQECALIYLFLKKIRRRVFLFPILAVPRRRHQSESIVSS